jgi:hypothetical protein
MFLLEKIKFKGFGMGCTCMCGVVSKELDGSTFKVAYEGLKL